MAKNNMFRQQHDGEEEVIDSSSAEDLLSLDLEKLSLLPSSRPISNYSSIVASPIESPHSSTGSRKSLSIVTLSPGRLTTAAVIKTLTESPRIEELFQLIMDDEPLNRLFREYCAKEYSLENLECYQDASKIIGIIDYNTKAERYQDYKLDELAAALSAFYEQYMKIDSPRAVNITSKCREEFHQRYRRYMQAEEDGDLIELTSDRANKSLRKQMDHVREQAYSNMTDTLIRFRQDHEQLIIDCRASRTQQTRKRGKVISPRNNYVAEPPSPTTIVGKKDYHERLQAAVDNLFATYGMM